MKVLITGGSGFIGSHLVEYFEGRAEVRVLDNLRSGHRKNLDGFKVEFIDGSILDRDLVRRAVEGVDYVFHLAALVSVPESVSKVKECVDLNVIGLLNVLEASAEAGVKKLCFASSAAIYGDNPEVPKVETMIPEPKSPYAITKLDGEYYCRFFETEGRLKTASLRFFNVFGPRQDPAGGYAAAVPIFMAKAVRGEPITVHGDGEQTRDFVFVKDIVSGLVFASQNEHVSGSFNVGYGGSVTINDLAQEIIRLAGSESQVLHGPVRAGDVKHSRASAAKLRDAGWEPVSSLEKGLAETMAWYRAASV